MPKAILTPEEQAELNHLVAEHQTALHHAVEMASAHGMESPLFLVAERRLANYTAKSESFSALPANTG